MATNPTDMITCPYNMSHRIQRYKMQFHLEKCRKGYPNAAKKICPFDATHHVNELELDYHVMTCPKRECFDLAKYQVGDADYALPPQMPAPQYNTTTENWDEEEHCSYDPSEHCANNKVLKKIKDATPSERKAFRLQQRKQYNS